MWDGIVTTQGFHTSLVHVWGPREQMCQSPHQRIELIGPAMLDIHDTTWQTEKLACIEMNLLTM